MDCEGVGGRLESSLEHSMAERGQHLRVSALHEYMNLHRRVSVVMNV